MRTRAAPGYELPHGPREIVFRTDASTAIGSGHAMRCLTLARALKARGDEVAFVSRTAAAGDLSDAIERGGFPVERLAARKATSNRPPEAPLDDWQADADDTIAAIASRYGRADWIVVDHYGLDARWQSRVRQAADHVMAIDDLANRCHACDVLLDQNLHAEAKGYDALVPSDARRLLGPRYALLRGAFGEARAQAQVRDGAVRCLLVFFGGVDRDNGTAKSLEAVAALGRRDLQVDVILGAASPHLADVRARCAEIGATLHHDPANVAALLAGADLAIGATGAVSWERCCVGLPAIVMSLAANQEPVARALADEGVALYLGRSESVTSAAIASALERLLGEPDSLRAMSVAALRLVDGRGIERVVRALDTSPLALRRAEASDRDDLYRWRNAEETRRYSHDSAAIEPEAHAAWLARTLADDSRVLLIAYCEGVAVGVLRYDFAVQQTTVSVYLVPGRHGRGDGPRLLAAGHSWLKAQRSDITAIRAEVLPENRASAAAFLEAGYRLQGGIYMKELR
jgi:UDP-2,4-diacetamido-2,4,6-trideoxy-beta-L-altropyranose hydrolase